jgi:hypothetical protein
MEKDARTLPFNLNLRRIFLYLCLVPFALIPLLSLNAGISGDEPVHYEQAENVYKYFATGGKDISSIDTPITFLKYYGQSIDNFSYLVNKLFGFQEPYITRHIINALAGALTILFSGLLAAELAGYGAGILAIIFLLLSPVFLGHTYNNLKDVPFALGYIVSIYFLVKLIRKLPVIHKGYLAGIAAGTGFAISVRIGGLVIVPIILSFAAWQAWVTRPSDSRAMWKGWFRLSVSLAVAILLACIIGIIDWPYGLQDPIRHPLESLNQMTHYMISLRQLFEGKLYWSEELPWYYAPKYFLMVSPAIILAGIPLFAGLYKKLGPVIFSAVVFSAFFPLIYVVALHSNLYGNIRHLLFIYPLFVVLSASGWSSLYCLLRKVSFRWALIGLLVFGLSGPLIHIIRNHPVEYVYFNRLSGGVSKAYHQFETDYYFHSLGPSVKWLEKEVLSKPGGDTLVVASNFPLAPFFTNGFQKIRTVYTTWYDRGKYDWDYGLFVNAYLGPAGLKGKMVLPSTIVHSVNVENFPMCLVLNRKDKRDLAGYQLFSSGNFAEAAAILGNFTQSDPGNETAWLYLGWSQRKMLDYNASEKSADQLLRLYPESEPARELKIWNYLDSRRFAEASALSEELWKINPRYGPAEKLRTAARDSLRAISR